MKVPQVTKKYLEGNLKGIEIKENTFHGFELNKVYTDCLTGNKYQIINIVTNSN